MFDQLDRLERGARIDPRAIEQQRNDSSAGYSAYDEQQGHYGIEQQHYEAWPRERNEFVEQPMTLDSFGK